MSRAFSCIISILCLLFGGVASLGQSRLNSDESGIVLDKASKFPNLIADVATIAKLRIFLAKDRYHSQEIVTLDLGMLVNNEVEYFFPRDLKARIIVLDNQGRRVPIESIYAVDDPPVFERQKRTILKGSYTLLLGCENQIMRSIDDSAKFVFDENVETLFEKNLFRTLPKACIDFKNASELRIFAEFENDLVVVPAKRESIKTAVGKVASNILSLKVIE